MRRVTEAEAQEMRAKGFDRKLLEQDGALKLGRRADDLILRVHQAFLEVTLGLHQAQGIDDYESEEVCLAYRERDEKEDWRVISAEDLNYCHSSLSFFDAQGMKFHLPAYMVAELRGEYHFEILFHLVSKKPGKQFSLLTKEQRAVVREFLLLIREDVNYSGRVADIDKALRGRWAV